MGENPWKKISQRYVFELTPFVKVRRDTVIQPNGQRGLYAVVERADAVIVAAKKSDGHLVLVRQWRYAAGFLSWELPMGSVDKGETPEEAAKRELSEETGFKASKITKIGDFFPAGALSNNRAHVFLAEDLVAGEKKLESVEVGLISVDYSLEKIKKMIQQGEIKDAFSITALWYYANADKTNEK
jgi:ADP-ribose pyrophosphatase